MSKTTETTETSQSAQAITFKDKQYLVSELSTDSKRFIEHMLDLDPKITKTLLELEQLQIAKEYVSNLLERSLEIKEPKEPTETVITKVS